MKEFTAMEAAKQIGRSERQVYKHAQRWGLGRRMFGGMKGLVLSESDIEFMKQRQEVVGRPKND